jgi:cytochrome c553
MQHKIILPFLLTSVLFSFIFISQCTSPEQSQQKQQKASTQSEATTPELAEYMSTMHYYTHKFALAVDAEHQELAQFYFHEIRALSDEIKKDIPGYEGYDIARFMGIFMDPVIQPVEDALSNKNWENARSEVLNVIDSCNSCHNATGHGFVNVTPGFDKNPYSQDFSSPE